MISDSHPPPSLPIREEGTSSTYNSSFVFGGVSIKESKEGKQREKVYFHINKENNHTLEQPIENEVEEISCERNIMVEPTSWISVEPLVKIIW